MIRCRIGYSIMLLSVACLYFFENNAGTRILLTASIVLPAWSLFCARQIAGKVGCRLALPEKLQKKEIVQGKCHITGAMLLPCCAVVCKLDIRNPLVCEGSAKELQTGSDAVSFSLSSACCGQLQVRMAIVEVRDWFGLWRFPLSVSAERSVPVLPRLHEVRIDLTETENWTASGQKNGGSRQKTGEPDSEIREYVPGDPVRQIHWKLSAKTDRLLLRENELSGGTELLLMLETALAGHSPKDMEAAVEGLLSASYALAQAAFRHDVCWYDHGSGELKWVEVETAREYDRLQKAILQSSSNEQAENLGEIFKSHYPHAHPARVIVFSPHAFSDVTSLLAEHTAVTMVLPENVPYGVVERGVSIITLPDLLGRQGKRI